MSSCTLAWVGSAIDTFTSVSMQINVTQYYVERNDVDCNVVDVSFNHKVKSAKQPKEEPSIDNATKRERMHYLFINI